MTAHSHKIKKYFHFYVGREDDEDGEVVLRGVPRKLKQAHPFLNDELVYFIHWILVKKENRGAGLGARLLREVTIWADRHRAPLVLQVIPFDDGPSERHLISFYRSFGFNVIDKEQSYMLRFPKTVQLQNMKKPAK